MSEESLKENYLDRLSFINAEECDCINETLKQVGDDWTFSKRYIATFSEKMELRDFPVDRQHLDMQYTIGNADQSDFPVEFVPLKDKNMLKVFNFKQINSFEIKKTLDVEIRKSDSYLSASGRTCTCN